MRSKNAMKKTLIFDENRIKNQGKTWADSTDSKICHKNCPWTLIFPYECIFNRFWAPRRDPKMLQKGRGTSTKTTLGPDLLGFLRPCEHVLQFYSYFYNFYLKFGPAWDAFSFQSGGHQSQTRQTPKSHFGHFGFSNFERSTSNVP